MWMQIWRNTIHRLCGLLTREKKSVKIAGSSVHNTYSVQSCFPHIKTFQWLNWNSVKMIKICLFCHNVCFNEIRDLEKTHIVPFTEKKNSMKIAQISSHNTHCVKCLFSQIKRFQNSITTLLKCFTCPLYPVNVKQSADFTVFITVFIKTLLPLF